MRLWHLRRLRAMSWDERRLRWQRLVREARHRRAFARGGADAVAGPPPGSAPFVAGFADAPWILSAGGMAAVAARWPARWRERTLAEASELLQGTFRWLGAAHDLGKRPAWRREAVSDVAFPAAYWSTLPTASPEGRFDLKHLWEPNLHPAFATLAKAYLLSGRSAFRDRLETLWLDWMEENPPLAGPNLLAPIETGLRLVHWGAALRFWAARERPPEPLLDAVFRSAHYQRFTVAENLSRHSSANNHLLGELATLALVDAAFPGLAPEGSAAIWDAALRREVLLQFAPDGGNREQAFHYHAFALALAALGAQAADARGARWPEPERARLAAAADFLAAGFDRAGRPFLYGDSDESEVLPLAEGARDLYRPALAHARILLGDDGAAGPEGDERAAWLLGEHGLPDPARPAPPPAASAAFPETGQVWLRRGGTEVHLNAGGLGYLSIAAHAHADALSVQVAVGGERIVADPGTFTYRGGDRWREALVRTASHPTVTVNGRDQAERLGPFMWGRSYRTVLEASGPHSAAASHDGYRDLGIVHRRRVEVAGDGAVTVEDALEGGGRVQARLLWPFPAGAEASDEDGGARVRSGDAAARVRLRVPSGRARLERGDPERPGSPCVSGGYDRLAPAYALVWEGEVDLPARWTTVIEPLPPRRER